MHLRPCLHGVVGTQVGEVTRLALGGVNRLSIISLILILSRFYMIAGVTRHMLSHLRGVPHLHVNRPLVLINKNIKSLLARDVHTFAQAPCTPGKTDLWLIFKVL